MPATSGKMANFELGLLTEEQANAIAELFVKLLPDSTVTVTLLEEIGWHCVNV